MSNEWCNNSMKKETLITYKDLDSITAIIPSECNGHTTHLHGLA